MSEPTLYDVAAMARPRDPAWALGPGETYPPAPPLWVCAEPGCECGSARSAATDQGASWRRVWQRARA